MAKYGKIGSHLPVMAKYGKIGSLPHGIREQINLRILDNHPFKDILEWLNAIPVVITILKDKFQGSPINENNLSEWKSHRGYGQWLALLDARELTQSLLAPRAPQDQALAKLSADQLTHALVVEYAAITQQLHDQPNSEALLTRLRQITADLSRMRRDNFREEQLDLEKKRIALQQAEAEQRTEAAHQKWTQRPDVRLRLYTGLAPDTIALIERDRGLTPRPPTTPESGQQGQKP